MSFYNAPEIVKARGLEIVEILMKSNDFNAMAEVLSRNIEALHDDKPAVVGLDTFLEHWKALLQAVPNVSSEVFDTVAEVKAEGGGKVWIFNRISGLPGGIQKDSVDMLEIDGDGKLVWIKDVQRVVGE